MKRLLLTALGWLAALLLLLWRLSLRIRVDPSDPRPALRAVGRRYIYAIAHAQQLGFILLSDDTPIAAMVSASADGDILAPLCRVRGVTAVRGSTSKRGKDKGGRRALLEMFERVAAGTPALLAVDGPRGPRGTVHWGAIKIARQTDACIVVAGVFPTRRSIFTRTWDRTQLPHPFSTLHGRFRPAIDPRDFPDDDQLRARVRAELHALELAWDPEEAAYTTGEPLVDGALSAGADPEGLGAGVPAS